MSNEPPISATYFPNVFETKDIESAKAIILTPEGSTTSARWELETPYLMELMANAFKLSPEMVVLDYGCGIGRMAKAMIEASGCSVIGVDISESMRKLAYDYVGSDRFMAVSPAECDLLIRGGLKVDAVISIWVLQHCVTPADDVARIANALSNEGRVFVLNMPKRAIPVMIQNGPQAGGFLWHSDNVDVHLLLKNAFNVLAEGIPDKQRTPNMGDVGAYWMALGAKALQ